MRWLYGLFLRFDPDQRVVLQLVALDRVSRVELLSVLVCDLDLVDVS